MYIICKILEQIFILKQSLLKSKTRANFGFNIASGAKRKNLPCYSKLKIRLTILNFNNKLRNYGQIRIIIRCLRHIIIQNALNRIGTVYCCSVSFHCQLNNILQ